MISSKIILAIFVALAISQSIVESCNSNTGTASSCNSNGTLNSACNDNCKCNSVGLLTCIEYKCSCNLKSQGGFGATCNSDCGCKSNLGLLCTNGICKCNTSVALWDTDQCINVETTADACDGVIGSLVSEETTAFKTVPSESGWKCVASTKTLYGPTYDEAISKGKYIVDISASASASTAYLNCIAGAAVRIQPSTDDVLETLFKKYTSTNPFWIGVAKNNQDGFFYYDNKTKSSLTLTDATKQCVKMIPGASIEYTSEDCATTLNYMCAL